MHTFLKSIGFKQLTTKRQEDLLIQNIIISPQRKRMIADPVEKDVLYAELTREFMPGIGIKVIGQYDEKEEFNTDYYFPYVEGRNESVNDECFIGKKMDSSAYSGLCEDDRIGVSLIFHLINSVDYLNVTDKKLLNGDKRVRLSGLCSDGIVILPTAYSKQVVDGLEENVKHVQMVAEARNGDKEAIEKLTLEEMHTYSKIGRRISDEDVFSIVETSLVPFGMEAEVYKMLGVIISLKKFSNPILKEDVYLLKVKCNGVLFDIAVNKSDLGGVPAVGRRFRGIVWLQGFVEF